MSLGGTGASPAPGLFLGVSGGSPCALFSARSPALAARGCRAIPVTAAASTLEVALPHRGVTTRPCGSGLLQGHSKETGA